MSLPSWHGATSMAPADLVEATLELHWAAQYIASAGQTFSEQRPDDSHRAMTWDAKMRAFVGEPFAGAYPFRAALRPEDLTLLLIDRTGGELGSLPLAGKTREEGFEWLSLGMATYLGGAPPRLERPDYDMPQHPVADRARFSIDQAAALDALTSIFGTAAELLEEIAAAETGASAVRCWPHHFDIATLITVESDEEGLATRTVGVGMAPSGGGYDHWYWYVSPWPSPDKGRLPSLSGAGSWHTDGWTGAVLTAEEIHDLDPAERAGAVRAFIDEAVAAARTALA